MSSANDFHYGVFPPDFIWGMANSSYQTEGAWEKDGKGESIWDRFCHENPTRIKDSSNGDTAMDSYHKYKEDVQLLKNMNAKMYRLSISWPRLLPKGTVEQVNQAGIDYYNKLIDELLLHGIEPCVTLFHWDLPQHLQEMGGWLNEELVQFFGEYARLCFDKFGDRVKYWITLNEPYVFVMKGYDFATFAPGIKQPKDAPYTAVHTMLKAHAVAYQIYKEEFKAKYHNQGKIGLSIDSSNYAPMDPKSEEDVQAADKAYEFRIGWVANPLYFGDYPEIMIKSVADKSKLEGLKASRLPEFDKVSSSLIKGTIDFFGLNYYTGELVQPQKPGCLEASKTTSPGWNCDLDTDRIRDPTGKPCGVWWQRSVPWGLRNTLNWVRKKYGNPTVIITENGMSECSDTLDDDGRVDFFKGHVNETLKAVTLDGCNVKGYLGWCFLDVFEWADGYTVGFGVHKVDRNSSEKTRTPKKSAKYLSKIFQDNGFLK